MISSTARVVMVRKGGGGEGEGREEESGRGRGRLICTAE